jgi:hypothetical protein
MERRFRIRLEELLDDAEKKKGTRRKRRDKPAWGSG